MVHSGKDALINAVHPPNALSPTSVHFRNDADTKPVQPLNEGQAVVANYHNSVAAQMMRLRKAVI